MTRISHAEANLAAEIRAVESGHRCYLTGENTARVLSDSTEGLHWIVTAQATHTGAGVVFHCQPEDGNLCHGHGSRWSRTPGRLTCRHAAVLARRLERSGLAAWVDGMWVATVQTEAVAPNDEAWRRNPFAALARMAS